MKLWVVAVGQRMPEWAQSACLDYAKRFPADWPLDIKVVKTEPRQNQSAEKCLLAERKRIEMALPADTLRIVLDERGLALSTLDLAQRLKSWQQESMNAAFVIGGPDGLDAEFKRKAHLSLRLSDLTLPHALARVILLEQLYRGISVLANHPYHRE